MFGLSHAFHKVTHAVSHAVSHAFKEAKRYSGTILPIAAGSLLIPGVGSALGIGGSISSGGGILSALSPVTKIVGSVASIGSLLMGNKIPNVDIQQPIGLKQQAIKPPIAGAGSTLLNNKIGADISGLFKKTKTNFNKSTSGFGSSLASLKDSISLI